MYTVAPNMIKVADTLAGQEYNLDELTLMKNAAKACFNEIYPLISSKDSIVILCGKGNNGGDGYELCRLLHKEFFKAAAVNVFNTEPCTQTAKAVYNRLLQDGGRVVPMEAANELIKNATVIIEAVFGVGFSNSLCKDSDIGKLFELCNKSEGCKRIAIDVPGGINSRDGTVPGIAFKAHLTLTLAFYKTGMLSYPAREYCGEIRLCKIGFPKELEDRIQKDVLIPDEEYLNSIIKKRESNTHKGTFGRLLMFCASPLMTGAGVLAANAALRCGVGLLNIARDSRTINILQHHLVEPIFSEIDTSVDGDIDELTKLSDKATALLTGCGLGNDENDKKAVFSLIKECNCPIILDADGINAVSENILVLKEARKTAILTPHPMEFSRLTGKSVADIQSDRINCARQFAAEYGCVLMLKGAATIIASPDGRLAVCTKGGAGLAKGGNGDVLAGACAALRAQGLSAFDSAVCAVYLHAAAGDKLTEKISEYGFLPSELPLAIAEQLP